MTNQELIRKAVIVHFACDKNNLWCDTKLEETNTIAKDFLRYFLTGNTTESLDKMPTTRRYKIKKQLIDRYIRNNTDGLGQ